MKAFIDIMGLNDVVNFSGYLEQEEIHEAYLDSDIFLLLSLSGSNLKVILDIMDYAVPIISTRVEGIPDLMSSEERGWLVTPNNSKHLHLAILSVLMMMR